MEFGAGRWFWCQFKNKTFSCGCILWQTRTSDINVFLQESGNFVIIWQPVAVVLSLSSYDGVLMGCSASQETSPETSVPSVKSRHWNWAGFLLGSLCAFPSLLGKPTPVLREAACGWRVREGNKEGSEQTTWYTYVHKADYFACDMPWNSEYVPNFDTCLQHKCQFSLPCETLLSNDFI